MRNYDQSKHEGVNWHYKYGYWVLTDINYKESELERESAAMQNLVVTELEKRKLCHSLQYTGTVFSWTKTVLERIKERKLSVESKIRILAFVSCVALLQLGRYVNYYSLSNLVRDLSLTQSTLKMLEVQSPFYIPGINNVKILRLHRTIPIHLGLKRKEGEESKEKE